MDQFLDLFWTHELDLVFTDEVVVNICVDTSDILILDLRQVFLQGLDHSDAVALELRDTRDLHAWVSTSRKLTSVPLCDLVEFAHGLSEIVHIPGRQNAFLCGSLANRHQAALNHGFNSLVQCELEVRDGLFQR